MKLMPCLILLAIASTCYKARAQWSAQFGYADVETETYVSNDLLIKQYKKSHETAYASVLHETQFNEWFGIQCSATLFGNGKLLVSPDAVLYYKGFALQIKPITMGAYKFTEFVVGVFDGPNVGLRTPKWNGYYLAAEYGKFNVAHNSLKEYGLQRMGSIEYSTVGVGFDF